MLTSLLIENFAIVSSLELNFNQGMTAFTGETGAGKSIMIDALLLALGERADVSVVRSGAEKCDISACFSFEPTSAPATWLIAHDLINEECELVLRRTIYAEGRSKSYINGQPFPLQKIKELGAMLVDVHGQHQHQTLLQHTTHREQLDHYANHHDLLDAVSRLYEQCQRTKQQLDTYNTELLLDARVQWVQEQLRELDALELQDNEMQHLHREHQCLHHACEYLECCAQIDGLLGADELPAVRCGLNHVLHLLTQLPEDDPQIKNATGLLNSALIQCDEALDEISRFSQQVQLDPERLQRVEERMSVLHQLARKYHIEASQLQTYQQQLENEQQQFQQTQHARVQLNEQYQVQLASYQQAALALRQSREQHAIKLAHEISVTIKELGMPHGFIQIEMSPLDKMHLHGMDKVEYKVCTNQGMLADGLAKIASGGELSRISLAIHMITAKRGATPTLLFDEVDVGIGGATAALVGQRLRSLGDRLQLFCVTHQPQVASCAHHHFVVEKYTENAQTFSRVISLSEAEKIDELARMLGGLKVTEQTRSHARELRDASACISA